MVLYERTNNHNNTYKLNKELDDLQQQLLSFKEGDTIDTKFCRETYIDDINSCNMESRCMWEGDICTQTTEFDINTKIEDKKNEINNLTEYKILFG